MWLDHVVAQCAARTGMSIFRHDTCDRHGSGCISVGCMLAVDNIWL